MERKHKLDVGRDWFNTRNHEHTVFGSLNQVSAYQVNEILAVIDFKKDSTIKYE